MLWALFLSNRINSCPLDVSLSFCDGEFCVELKARELESMTSRGSNSRQIALRMLFISSELKQG